MHLDLAAAEDLPHIIPRGALSINEPGIVHGASDKESHLAMLFRGLLIVGLLLCVVCPAFAQNNAESAADSGGGSLVIMGGAERFDHREIWEEIVQLAGGPGCHIAVFPTASLDPIRKGNWVVEALNKAGAQAFLVPLAWRHMEREPQEVASDPEIVAAVRQAQGVFFIGGGQERITRALRTPQGEPTPLLNAIWNVYRDGGMVAGTSAGAAVMSRVMYRNPDSVLETLEQGVSMGQEIDHGFGFLDHNWFVDQHCLVRGRFARALVAMVDQGFRYGLGIDENSAVVIEQNRYLRVIGYRGALVFDLSQAEHDPNLGRFNLTNARLSFLDRGDRLDLQTLEMTPSPQKLNDTKLDPNAPEFETVERPKLFFNDVLGNTAVVDLMAKLMDNADPEAIGLAFDGHRARQGMTAGFEFRFARDAQSVAWYTEATGGDDYTIFNIRVDIRPIRFPGPLYEYDE